MLLITFSVVLASLVIFCLIQKKYLYLFVPCMLFLPEYYGIEISRSFPLVTVTRILLFIFFIYAFINKKRSLSDIHFKALPKTYYFLVAYFLLRIIANLYYIPIHNEAIKTIFSLVIEEAFFLIAVFWLKPSNDEIINLIRVIVWSATLLFLVGIYESFTFIRPFDALYTVTRVLPNTPYIRLGLLRATATLLLPNFFCNACLLVLSLTLYLFNITHNKLYFLCIFVDLMGAIHSGSRAFVFSLILLLFYYCIFVLQTGSRRIIFFKNTALIALSSVTIIMILCSTSPRLKYFYTGTVKSLLNEVGFEFNLAEGAPEGVNGYGGNEGGKGSHEGGLNSRRAQLTGIYYTMLKSPIFGLGNGAVNRNEIRYYFTDYWCEATAIDVGLVEIIMNEGLLGFLAFCSLFCFLIFNAKNKLDSFSNRIYKLTIFDYLVCTLSTVNMMSFLILLVSYAIIKNETLNN